MQWKKLAQIPYIHHIQQHVHICDIKQAKTYDIQIPEQHVAIHIDGVSIFESIAAALSSTSTSTDPIPVLCPSTCVELLLTSGKSR